MCNYTPSACCCVTGTSEVFILSSLLIWWLSFTIGLATYLIAMVTQLPWQKYDTSVTLEDVPDPFSLELNMVLGKRAIWVSLLP